MSFTLKQIKALLSDAGVAAENLTALAEDICNRHNTALDAIKEERDAALVDAKTLADTKAELESLKAANGKDSFKVKYEALKQEYDDYKKGIESEKTASAKLDAYKALCKELNISDKIIDKVAKLADLDKEEIEDGKLKNADTIKASLAEEWKDFIVKTGTKGAGVENPPTGGAAKKTMSEIYKKDDHGRYVMNATERQAEIAKLSGNE